MDENSDGLISQAEFVSVRIYTSRNVNENKQSKLRMFQACMAQKKFSTMLTLKIIDVFITDEQHSAIEKNK